MKKKIVFIVLWFFILSGWFIKSNFIIGKNNKNQQQSSSALKEQCCDLLVKAFKMTTELLHQIATQQQVSMHMVTSLVEGNSFIQCKKRDEIVLIHDDFKNYYQRQQQIKILLDQQNAFLDKYNMPSMTTFNNSVNCNE